MPVSYTEILASQDHQKTQSQTSRLRVSLGYQGIFYLILHTAEKEIDECTAKIFIHITEKL